MHDLKRAYFFLMDVLIKITNEYDVGQVMFSRAIFGLIPIFFDT